MKFFNKFVNFSLIIVLLNFSTSLAYSKDYPVSFADLAEKLMPSVVNISSTQTIKTTLKNDEDRRKNLRKIEVVIPIPVKKSI